MPEPFKIDYELLPPEVKVKLWALALDANTSKVHLEYKEGVFKSGLTYDYGGNLEAALSIKTFTLTGSTDRSFGARYVFKGFDFNAKINIPKETASVGVTWGAPLLPFPTQLSDSFNKAGVGVGRVVGDVGSAADDPLKWYGTHSDDISAITKAVSLGQQIAKKSKGASPVGASLTLEYKESVLLIQLGVGVSF